MYIGPKSRTERSRKTKIGTEVAHVTRDSDTTFKVKRSRSPGRFAHGCVGASGGCSGGRRNVLAVRNCCYVAVSSAAQGASASTGEGEGRDISWRPPAYSLFISEKSTVKLPVICWWHESKVCELPFPRFKLDTVGNSFIEADNNHRELRYAYIQPVSNNYTDNWCHHKVDRWGRGHGLTLAGWHTHTHTLAVRRLEVVTSHRQRQHRTVLMKPAAVR